MEEEKKEFGDETFGDETAGAKSYEKRRLYVREISGFTYSLAKQLKELRKIPRVIKGKDLKFKGGPQMWNVNVLTPRVGTAQALYAHMVVYAPESKSQRHGHMNEAIFYILDGKGYDIHDGKRYDWEAGDVLVVENACVHQHFHSDLNNIGRVLVIKSKPLYQFMNLFFQEIVEEAPTDPIPGWENFKPKAT